MEIKMKVEKVFNVRYLKVKAGVRYWEDATVNGEEDEDGDLIPCRDVDYWCPIIDIEFGKIANWDAGKSADIHYKVCDDGEYTLLDYSKNEIKTIEGYVPECLAVNDNGFGDYIIMMVDENGVIEGWKPTFKEWTREEDN